MQRLKVQPDLTSKVKAIEEDGYAYFPGTITPDQVSKLKTAIDRLTPLEASFNRSSTPDDGDLNLTTAPIAYSLSTCHAP